MYVHSAAVLLALSLVPALRAEPLPFDMAYRLRRLNRTDIPHPSPDGRFVAFVVLAHNAAKDRFLPNGTPGDEDGSRLYVADAAGRESWEACPEGADCWRPSWAPDSRRLAFFSDKGGPVRLWVHDLGTRGSRPVSDAVVKPKLWSGDQARWSPDGSKVYVALTGAPWSQPTRTKLTAPGAAAFVRRSGLEGESDAYPSTEAIESFFSEESASALAELDVRSGRARVLVSSSALPTPNVLRLSATGRRLSYVSVYRKLSSTAPQVVSDLAVVDVAGGPPRVLARGVPHQGMDFLGLDGHAWAPGGDRLAYWSGKSLWLADFDGERPFEARRLAPELGDMEPVQLLFSPDGAGLLANGMPLDASGREPEGPASFAWIPLDGRPARRWRLPEGWSSPGALKADEGVFWAPDGEACRLTARTPKGKVFARLDLGTGEVRVLLEDAGGLSQIRAPGSDGFFAVYTDYRTPADVYWYSRDLSSRRRVSRVEPGLDSVPAGTEELFETPVPLRDGSTAALRTAVLLPEGAARGARLPAVVIAYPGVDLTYGARLYGGGEPGTVPALLYTSRGYAVLLADVPLKRGDGQPVDEAVDMLLPQVRKAAGLGYIDPDRVALLGHSYGGYMAAAIASRTRAFRAAISIAGVFDLGAAYGSVDDRGTSFGIEWCEGGQGRLLAPPWPDPKRYIDNSPYYQAHRIETPLLIIKGGDDNIFGSSQDAQRMFAALQRLGKTAQLAVYPGEGHELWMWSPEHGADAAERIVSFLDRYLKPAR